MISNTGLTFEQLADTVLEMSLSEQEKCDLITLADDPTPAIKPAQTGPKVVVRAVGGKKFTPKSIIRGPTYAKPASPRRENRIPAQARLSRRIAPYSAPLRPGSHDHPVYSTPPPLERQLPIPCPLPSPFRVPPPPLIPSITATHRQPIPPLVIAAKPKLTNYMIDTLSSSLVQQCKTNFNILISENEVKSFLKSTTIQQLTEK